MIRALIIFTLILAPAYPSRADCFPHDPATDHPTNMDKLWRAIGLTDTDDNPGTTVISPGKDSCDYRIVFTLADENANPAFNIDRSGNRLENHPGRAVIARDSSHSQITFHGLGKTVNTDKPAATTTNDCATGPCIIANPPAGTYASPQKIHLTTEHPQGLKVAIYYSKDGTKPTPDSPRYIGEDIEAVERGLEIDLDLRVLAVDSNGGKERSRFTYRIGRKTRNFREETIYFLSSTPLLHDTDPDIYHNGTRATSCAPPRCDNLKNLIGKSWTISKKPVL